MILYHGTSEELARKAIKSGIKPRAITNNSHWKDTVESSPDCVYLTDAYAPYFAQVATPSGKRIAIIEIDISKLSLNKMVPDEDFLEQATRGKDGIDKPMIERTEYYRNNLKRMASNWMLSLQHMGTCAYMGTIPVKAITRVAFMNPKDNLAIMSAAMDPSISIMNYMVMKNKYRAINKWFFEDVDISASDEFSNIDLSKSSKESKEMILKAREQKKIGYSHKPVEILDLREKSKSGKILNMTK